jgi:hypothetical protein
VLVQARRFKDLGAATGDDIQELEVVTVVPRQIEAPELAPAEPLGVPSLNSSSAQIAKRPITS